MRRVLSHIANDSNRFSARTDKFGISKRTNEVTVLLKNIKKLNGKLLTDHLWVLQSEICCDFSLGDNIEFNAEIYQYKRKTGDIDFGLNNFSDVIVNNFKEWEQEKIEYDFSSMSEDQKIKVFNELIYTLKENNKLPFYVSNEIKKFLSCIVDKYADSYFNFSQDRKYISELDNELSMKYGLLKRNIKNRIKIAARKKRNRIKRIANDD